MKRPALLATHLREHAGQYFGDVSSNPEVQLRWSSERINSTLYEFRIVAERARHTVLVKIPFAVSSPAANGRGHATLPDRPRLCPKPPRHEKCGWEYSALAEIERRVQELADERFAAVRMLDLLPAQSALVMEKVSARSLSRLLPRAARFRLGATPPELLEAMHRAGAWLRLFHTWPAPPHAQTRHATRVEFVESVRAFTAFLAESGDAPFFASLETTLAAAARQSLPERLPAGWSHGDYAPRNVLVDRAGRVQVIDTMGRWRAPIYEDLGRFLCALHASVPQVWTHGWAYRRQVLCEFERRFLQGYFGAAPIPSAILRLFECLALLDRWASLVQSSRSARGLRGWAKGGRRWWWQSYFQQHMHGLLAQGAGPAAARSLMETLS